MIFTLTMNPSLDRYLYVDELKEDDTVRVRKVADYPAGKAIDVSRAIKELGGTSVAIALLGGYNGRRIEELLDEEGVIYTAVRVTPETRMNVIIQKGETQYRLSLPGQQVDRKRIEKIREVLQALVREGDWIVISGSLPRGISPDFYTGIIFMLKQWGIRVYFDADGENLRAGLIGEPDGIKPNVYELSRIYGKSLDPGNIIEVLEAARFVHETYRVEEILVSLGAEGAVLYTKDMILKAKVPKLPVVSAVGAGDSFLAAYVLKRYEGEDLETSLKWAAAAGSAAVLTPGTELCKRDDVLALLDRITIERVK